MLCYVMLCYAGYVMYVGMYIKMSIMTTYEIKTYRNNSVHVTMTVVDTKSLDIKAIKKTCSLFPCWTSHLFVGKLFSNTSLAHSTTAVTSWSLHYCH